MPLNDQHGHNTVCDLRIQGDHLLVSTPTLPECILLRLDLQRMASLRAATAASEHEVRCRLRAVPDAQHQGRNADIRCGCNVKFRTRRKLTFNASTDHLLRWSRGEGLVRAHLARILVRGECRLSRGGQKPSTMPWVWNGDCDSVNRGCFQLFHGRGYFELSNKLKASCHRTTERHRCLYDCQRGDER